MPKTPKTIVADVRVHGHVESVQFVPDTQRKQVTAKAKGKPRIVVHRRTDGHKGFVAQVKVAGKKQEITARTPQRAFARAVKTTWH